MYSRVFLEELVKALKHTPIPSFSEGASGYFSKPQKTLDPALFYRTQRGDTIRPEVWHHVLGTLFRFWKKSGFKEPERWTTVWFAGSGISYQWAGDRGNGDLDTIMGIDWPLFYQCNPQWVHTSIDQTTDFIDNQLRTKLWPRTARTVFGGKTFELTYYVNQDASDIRNINPYAAYNLTTDSWTVRPPEHTAFDDDPGTPTWRIYAAQDVANASSVAAAIREILPRLDNANLNEGQRTNLLSLLHTEVVSGAALLTTIHSSRREAFRRGGLGYFDLNNWRWQMAKKNGVVAVLGAIEHAYREAEVAAETSLYGEPLSGADQLVLRAAFSQGDRS